MADESKVISILLEIQRKQDALVEGVEHDRDAAKDRHQAILRRFDAHEKRLEDLEAKRGPVDPPAVVAIANEAKRTASDASLEGQSTRGMVLAVDARVVEVAKALDENKAEIAKVAKALDENNTMTRRILDNVAAPIGAILRARPVQAAAMAVLLAALGAAGAMLQNRATGPLMLPAVPAQDGGAP